jgi:hypothetical protein
LRLAKLPLPSFAVDGALGPDNPAGEAAPLAIQRRWPPAQIQTYGRHVRLRLDLLLDANSGVAGVCRSLTYRSLVQPRIDICTIEGLIDRRDGWPITLTLSRRAQSRDGATESQFRRFDRVAAIDGFVPPANPCSVRG